MLDTKSWSVADEAEWEGIKAGLRSCQALGVEFVYVAPLHPVQRHAVKVYYTAHGQQRMVRVEGTSLMEAYSAAVLAGCFAIRRVRATESRRAA